LVAGPLMRDVVFSSAPVRQFDRSAYSAIA
jgi:hypothetical protein